MTICERDQLQAEVEKLRSKEKCEHCGSDRIYHGPPDCPGCGAPNCCQTCCKQAALESEVDRLKEALSVKPGGCRMLSRGDVCDCTLCRQSKQFRELLKEKDDLLTEARQEVEWLKEEATWVRNKLGLPEDTPFVTGGGDTLAGKMHVICSDAHGYRTYIVAHKCDDKQGEIARLTVRVRELEQQLTAAQAAQKCAEERAEKSEAACVAYRHWLVTESGWKNFREEYDIENTASGKNAKLLRDWLNSHGLDDAGHEWLGRLQAAERERDELRSQATEAKGE